MTNFIYIKRKHLLNSISRKRWGRVLRCLLLFILLFISFFLPFTFNKQDYRALAQVSVPCATPGQDGPKGTLSGLINTYYPGSASVNAGATSIPVGSLTPAGNPAIAPGDLLLVIQMQDAEIDSSNTDAYGDGISGDVPNITTPQPSTAASGWKQTTAGTFEYAVATSSVSSGLVSIRGTGANNGLLNSYYSSNASATKGQSTYQVIRVPQYSSATLGNATALAWNGSVGGILVYDVTGNLDLSGTVDVSGRGFRGGGASQLSGVKAPSGYFNTDFRTPATANLNGSKGEGIAGTPRYVLKTFDDSGNPTSFQLFDTNNEGYPSGSYGRGAPGNAGGGSTDGKPDTNAENSGGGGGGNGGYGGRGGRTWKSQVTTGGFGGKEFPASTTRLILGGGGGAGTTNNSSTYPPANNSGTNKGLNSSGAAGGGMVMIRTNTVTGAGTINANGANTLGVTRDGGGGGGAGGTVFITTMNGSLAGLTLSVKGGEGGDAVFNEAHGPGGGGGGGVIVTNASPNGVTVAANGLDGGDSGRTGSDRSLPFDSEAGTGLVVPLVAGKVPGTLSGAECSARLTVVKTTSTPNINNQPAGTTATYAIALSNAANQAAATDVNISDTLPSGFTYVSTSSIALTGGATQPTTTNPTVGSNNPIWGNFTIPGGAQVQITFVVNVAKTVAAGTYQNPATVTYLDPGRTTATGTKTVSYDPASSTGEDVTIKTSKLLLIKRITRINNQDLADIVDGRSDVPTNAANYVPEPYAGDDNHPKWTAGYLRGLINASTVKPGDELEYTIYFLSSGDNAVKNVTICDLIPANSTFVDNAFSPGSGIAFEINATTNLTNASDSDRAEYIPPNTIAPAACNKADIANNITPPNPLSAADNKTGAVLVNVVSGSTTLPEPNQPAYGFIRFRVKVK